VPLALLAVFCGVLGLAIGSFLNVVIWRVPRGESVVRPPSHCPSCGHAVRGRDNVPVVSWLLLRARCRDCHEPISPRYPAVELATGALFAGFALHFGYDAALPAFLYFAAIGIALALIDFDTKRLPNAIVLPSYPVGLVLLGVAAIAQHDGGGYLRALLGLVALYGFYFALAWIYPSGMGFGDVKLAGVLGLYLGWLGWGELIVGAFLGFAFGSVVGIGLLAVRRAGRKTHLPFGPFMIAGAVVAVFVGHAIAHAYVHHTVA
jgi:leader peptidase (prepilin peptidase)/N-methyltransferase